MKLDEGTELLESGLFKQAEPLLRECDKLYGEYLQKDHLIHLIIKEPLARIYEGLNQYKEAIKYRTQCAYYSKLTDPEDFFEPLYHLVRVVDLYLDMKREAKNETEKDFFHSNAKIYFIKSYGLFKNILDLELKTGTSEHLKVIPRLEELVHILGGEGIDEESMRLTMDRLRL
jgi:hypothetical protein